MEFEASVVLYPVCDGAAVEFTMYVAAISYEGLVSGIVVSTFVVQKLVYN